MHTSETTLQVFHRHFKIPLEIYFNSVVDFPNPWDERAYQFFVTQHLIDTNDSGIVGMVRQEIDGDYVYLDAAIRYPQTTDSNKDVRG